MYDARSPGERLSEIVVKPRTSENRMVSSAAVGSMLYLVGSRAISSTSSGGTYCPNKAVNSRLLRDSTK